MHSKAVVTIPVHDLTSKTRIITRLRETRDGRTATKHGLDVGRMADTTRAGGAVAAADQGGITATVEAEVVRGLVLAHLATQVAQRAQEVVVGTDLGEQVADCVGIVGIELKVLGSQCLGGAVGVENEFEGHGDISRWDHIREVLRLLKNME